MSKRLLKDKLVKFSDINEELAKVDISESTFVTKSGKLYTDYGNGYAFPLKTFINKSNGYLYVNFKGKNGKHIQRRVHTLVAKAFIPNENNLPYVCHKDNNKANPSVDNLEWGTASYNTKKAFEDGLEVNARGWDDNQSKPISVYGEDCKLYKVFGSVGEASRELGVTKSAILFQCNNLTKKKPRTGYYFRFYNEYKENFLVL